MVRRGTAPAARRAAPVRALVDTRRAVEVDTAAAVSAGQAHRGSRRRGPRCRRRTRRRTRCPCAVPVATRVAEALADGDGAEAVAEE